MPTALPTQFDDVSGLDFSGLSSVTAVQLLQSINQLAPLANIGGVVWADGSVYYPGIINNPRFVRYIWIDTQTTPPVAKIYDGSGVDGYANWTSIALPDGSVTTAKLGNLAVTVAKIAVGTARYLLRTNAAGSAVEFVNPNAIFTAGDIEVDKLGHTGAPATLCYLKKDAGGGKSWGAPNFNELSGFLTVDKINPGSNFQVLAVSGGVSTWSNLSNVLQANDVDLSDINATGALGYQVPSRNSGNTQTLWTTPILTRSFAVTDTAAVSVSLPVGAAGVKDFAHGLGQTPVIARVVLINTSAELGFSIGDEVDIRNLYDNAAANNGGRPAFVFTADATNVRVSCPNVAAGERVLYRKDTGAVAAITDASWKIKVYAYA